MRPILRHKKKPLIILAIFVLAASYFLFNDINTVDPKKSECLHASVEDKFDCLKTVLDKFVENEDVGGAIAYLYYYQRLDDNLGAEDCHFLAHYVGDEAYRLYRKGYELDFGDEAQVCNHGYYHSFMTETILSGEGERASEFCEALVAKQPGVSEACYHGIGHGAIFAIAENTNVSLETALTEGINMCEKILGKESGRKLIDCVKGVYGGLADTINLEEAVKNYPDKQSFYELCFDVQDAYKEICYEEVAVITYPVNPNSFSEVIEKAMSDSRLGEGRISLVGGLAVVYASNIGEALSDEIEVCKSLPVEYKDACLLGMVSALYWNEPDSSRDRKAEAFCKKEVLSEEERNMCFDFLKKEREMGR